jgi:carbamoyl-phosphate synthase small subunit
VVALTEVDTRALARHLRTAGAQRGVLSTRLEDVGRLRAVAGAAPAMEGADLATAAGTRAAYRWGEGTGGWRPEERADGSPHVVVLDFGAKRTILRRLVDLGAAVTVVPGTAPAAEVLALGPDGVVVSNGPGDPAALGYAVETVRGLLGRVPLLGICLGHQLLGLAVGGRTCKLPFGHHGCNQPVLDVATGRVAISSQNHGFAVEAASLPAEVVVSHTSLFDGTVEGLRHRTLPALSVQFHPEAAPGPHDADDVFERFLALASVGAGGGSGAAAG